jgi:hypothetical protein
MEATCSSETLVDFQRTSRRYIPEDSTLHDHRCENLKSYIMVQSCLKQPGGCRHYADVSEEKVYTRRYRVLPSFHTRDRRKTKTKNNCHPKASYSLVPSSCGFLLLERKTGPQASRASYLSHPPHFLSCVIEGHRSLHGPLTTPISECLPHELKSLVRKVMWSRHWRLLKEFCRCQVWNFRETSVVEQVKREPLRDRRSRSRSWNWARPNNWLQEKIPQAI